MLSPLAVQLHSPSDLTERNDQQVRKETVFVRHIDNDNKVAVARNIPVRRAFFRENVTNGSWSCPHFSRYSEAACHNNRTKTKCVFFSFFFLKILSTIKPHVRVHRYIHNVINIV